MKRLACLALAALGLTGCRPVYETIVFELVTTPPVPVRIDAAGIELPVGLAVAVRVRIESSTGPQFTDDDSVVLRPDHSSVVLSDTTGDEREFVLVGIAPGETCIAVEVNYVEEECIPTRVLASE